MVVESLVETDFAFQFFAGLIIVYLFHLKIL